MKKLLCVFALLAFATCIRAEIISTSESEIWVLPIVSGDITWSSKGSQSSVYTIDDTGEDGILNKRAKWINTSAFSALSLTYGKASTTDNYLYGDVYARTDATTVIFPYATGNAFRWGYFIANSDGYVEFSANYQIEQQLRTEYTDELAYGFAEVMLGLYNETASEETEDYRTLENEIYDGVFFTDSESGALTVRLWFNAGDVGSFEACAYDEAETEMKAPEPATIALLAIGALALLRRKK